MKPLHQQSADLSRKIASARLMAIIWAKPFTVWQRGDIFAIASGDPRNDASARKAGWIFAAIVTPPQA